MNQIVLPVRDCAPVAVGQIWVDNDLNFAETPRFYEVIAVGAEHATVRRVNADFSPIARANPEHDRLAIFDGGDNRYGLVRR